MAGLRKVLKNLCLRETVQFFYLKIALVKASEFQILSRVGAPVERVKREEFKMSELKRNFKSLSKFSQFFFCSPFLLFSRAGRAFSISSRQLSQALSLLLYYTP